MTDDEVIELLPFLGDARADVRAMVAQGVAGYTTTPEGTANLIRHGTKLYGALVALLERAEESGGAEAAASAAAALVNLSQQPAERVRLLDTQRVVAAACACVAIDEPAELAEYSSMLLVNLTSVPSGIEQLLAARVRNGGEDALSSTLLPRLIHSKDSHLAHLAMVLTNAAQNAECRALLLRALSKDASEAKDASTVGTRLIGMLCGHMSSPDTTRRLGVIRTLRNLCFAASPSGDAAIRALLIGVEKESGGPEDSADLTSDDSPLLRVLISRLAARLAVVHARYSPEERAGFAPELRTAMGEDLVRGAGDKSDKPPSISAFLGSGAEAGAAAPEEEEEDGGPRRAPQEAELEGRMALTETLLLLTASPRARAVMRALGIYAVLRDAHLAEPEARIRSQNEQLVDLFYLSEGSQQPPAEGEEHPAIEEVTDDTPSAEVDEDVD